MGGYCDCGGNDCYWCQGRLKMQREEDRKNNPKLQKELTEYL